MWSAGVGAQESPLALAARLELDYRIVPNVTYLTASNWEAKLDLYVARTPLAPRPTIVFIHGGGWRGGSKESKGLAILPYLDMGMNVVNVEYRLQRVAQAPAAVEDCRCALRWVIQHAKEYGIDVNRLVVSGESAGGHLALTTGMLPAAAGLDRQCPGADNLKVAAIVNWYGISDVNELLDGPNMKTYAVGWLGSAPDREQVARRVSPIAYVRAGLPPILTIHGDADPTVPYPQSVRLHKALTDVGVPNELMTVPGGKHGFDCCTLSQRAAAYVKIREFLTRHHVLDGSTAPATGGTDSLLAWTARLENDYRIVPNVTYLTASNWEAKADLYVTRTPGTPRPTLLFIHGGGWTHDSKDRRNFVILPYLDMGMNVISIEYRLAPVAPAPAAVEDCRCALRWVIQHAKEYGVDVNHLVVAGDSAGGHLALTTGMLPAFAGLDRQCPGPDNLKVAAILNWYGISDVNELLDGPNMQAYAVSWLGSALDRGAIAKRVSPITYVRAGLPPVLTVHGTADPAVPYAQTVRFHQALTASGVPNELLTMPGGRHGFECCTLAQRTNAYERIRGFLMRHHVLVASEPGVTIPASTPTRP